MGGGAAKLNEKILAQNVYFGACGLIGPSWALYQDPVTISGKEKVTIQIIYMNVKKKE